MALQCNNVHDWHRLWVPFLSRKHFRFCGFSYSCQDDFVLIFCQTKFEVRKTSSTWAARWTQRQIYEQVHGAKAQGRPDAAPSKHLPSRVVGTIALFFQKIRLLFSIPDSTANYPCITLQKLKGCFDLAMVILVAVLSVSMVLWAPGITIDTVRGGIGNGSKFSSVPCYGLNNQC